MIKLCLRRFLICMRLLWLPTLIFVCSCSSQDGDFSVPMKLNGDIRHLVLKELNRRNIPFRENGTDFIFINKNDQGVATFVADEIIRNAAPIGLSISYDIKIQPNMRQFLLDSGIHHKELEMDGMTFFVFETQEDMDRADEYSAVLDEERLKSISDKK